MGKITVEINGVRKDLTDVFIREFFQRGIIGPETRIWRNGLEMRLMDAPDLMAPPPSYRAPDATAGGEGVAPPSDAPAFPPLELGVGAYNRTYNPEAGRGSEPSQTNRFAIFMWIGATVILLLVLGAFIAYKADDNKRPSQIDGTATQSAEEAYESTPEDLGETDASEFEELLDTSDTTVVSGAGESADTNDSSEPEEDGELLEPDVY